MREFGVRPNRELGQNFLIDDNILDVIGRAAELDAADVVLEVGGGLGVLSEYLAERVTHLHVVEVDRSLEPALRDALGPFGQRATLHLADAVELHFGALEPVPTKVVANLPYGVAATVILKALEELPDAQLVLAMVQREVGERLAAAPGSPAYGAPSAKVAALAGARVLAPVSRRVFIPEPHVDSVLVGLARRPHPALAGLGYPQVARVIDAAFSQRRKTLRNALRTLGLDAGEVEALGRAAGVDLGLRAERLDVPAFAALARNVDPAPGRG
jgi:16S rRNA (adenine1518-N6/adenine1519-N6)-dimethyltransferase